LLQGSSVLLYNADQDAEYGHFVCNTYNGHIATGIKGSYTPGSATVTFRKKLDDGDSNTTVVRCDGPVFGNSGAAITKYGICEYPDNRGDNVSFIAFDTAKYYDVNNFPDDPPTEFVNYTGYNVGNWWYNCTGAVAGFKSSISVDPASTKNIVTWQIQCSGNAPSYFAGPIQYSSSDLITDDNHLVTKKYVDDKLENGATQITLPPNTDPATAEPLAIIILVSDNDTYVGAGKISGYLLPDQVPARATGAVWQFREDGTSDWFLGTASYIAYPGTTAGTEKDMGDLQAAVTEAQAMTAEFASNARVKVLLNFGPTNGKSYEVRLAYETAAGVGAWEYDDGRFNPSGY
jgi:hypothetical protein